MASGVGGSSRLVSLASPVGSALFPSQKFSFISTAQLPKPAQSSRFLDPVTIQYLIPIYVTYGLSSFGQQALKPMVAEREKRLVALRDGMSIAVTSAASMSGNISRRVASSAL